MVAEVLGRSRIPEVLRLHLHSGRKISHVDNAENRWGISNQTKIDLHIVLLYDKILEIPIYRGWHMVPRHFWLSIIEQAWQQRSVVWLSGVRRYRNQNKFGIAMKTKIIATKTPKDDALDSHVAQWGKVSLSR